MLLEHMQKKFKIKGGCQSGRKAVTHNSKSDLPLAGKIVYVLHRSARLEFQASLNEISNNRQ